MGMVLDRVGVILDARLDVFENRLSPARSLRPPLGGTPSGPPAGQPVPGGAGIAGKGKKGGKGGGGDKAVPAKPAKPSPPPPTQSGLVSEYKRTCLVVAPSY